MRALPAALLALLLVPASAAAGGVDRPARLAIPAGRLDVAIGALGEQADVTIGLIDPTLAALRVHGVSGRLGAAPALARLLAGTAAVAIGIDAETFRIARRPTARSPLRAAAPVTPADASSPDPPPAADILVTAGKRGERLATYPGAVAVIDPAMFTPDGPAHGSEALLGQLPVLAATHLGPGRNKLFIRGVADSSFNGPSEATVGQYLGEVRLNYNAPDPDLALYDIAQVEVLEGPQGTLYGAGTLGGIVRLVPNPPDAARASLSLAMGAALAAHGEPGEDQAIVANLPLIGGALAARGTVYQSLDGGYIDDPGRHRRDINRIFTRGGRLALRWTPAGDWTIDAGAVLQNIDSADGQYAERGLPPLERASVIAQPFDNDYSLGDIVVRHHMGASVLVSATSIVDHDVDTSFDASPSRARPTRYHEGDHITLLTNETRLSHDSASGGGWVLGAEALRSSERLRRTLGPLGEEASIAGTRDVVEQGSLFGEATLPLGHRLFATGGARIAVTRLIGHGIDIADRRDEPRRHDVSALPTAGLSWRAGPALTVYARYQEGYRAGGLAIQDGRTQRFAGDSIGTWEIGLRAGRPDARMSMSATLSYAHWENIQADLVQSDGLPFTANIGSGRIAGAELQANWRLGRALSLRAGLFFNDSRLAHPAPAFAGERDASLPNIADATAHLDGRYVLALPGRAVTLIASVNYVGRSRLGVGPALDLDQGRYADTAAGLSVPLGAVTLALDATNLLDHRGNIFALGNPFGVLAGRQVTPLRPRTVRIGMAAAF